MRRASVEISTRNPYIALLNHAPRCFAERVSFECLNNSHSLTAAGTLSRSRTSYGDHHTSRSCQMQLVKCHYTEHPIILPISSRDFGDAGSFVLFLFTLNIV